MNIVPKPEVDKEARKALAEDAQALLEDRAFRAAIVALEKHFVNQMMQAMTEIETMAWKAKIQALLAIPQQLAIFVSDQKVAMKREQRR